MDGVAGIAAEDAIDSGGVGVSPPCLTSPVPVLGVPSREPLPQEHGAEVHQQAPAVGAGMEEEVRRRTFYGVDKAWGWSAQIGADPPQYLCWAESGYSSLHQHLDSRNAFFCVSAVLRIELPKYPGESDPYFVYLGQGESQVLLPGAWHRLVVVKPGWFVEVYGKGWTPSDIVRFDCGSGQPYEG